MNTQRACLMSVAALVLLAAAGTSVAQTDSIFDNLGDVFGQPPGEQLPSTPSQPDEPVFTPPVEPPIEPPPGEGGGNITELPLPRNNVKPDTLSARSPGNLVQEGVARTQQNIQDGLRRFGNANITLTEDTLPTNLRDAFLTSFANTIATTLDAFALLVQTALENVGENTQ